MKGAVLKVQIKDQPNDVLAADDSAQIVVPPPRTLNVMLVSKKGNLWLEKFLESTNLKAPAVVAPEAFEEKMKDPQAVASQFDVIMFDRYQPAALPPAGNFIFVNSVPPNSKLKAAMENGGLVLLKEQMVLDWERNHPLLRHLNLKFMAQESLKLQVPLDAQVLVEGTKGPLIVLYRDGRSTHLVLGFDIGDSTWPTAASFPIFMDNALQYLALGTDMDVRQSHQPGATPRIPRYNLQQAGNPKQLTIHGPPAFGDRGDMKVNVPDGGDFALPSLDRVGLYILEPPIPQYEKLAVNLLDDNESNLLPAGAPPASSVESITSTGGKSRLELWRWIVAFAAIPLCLIEWWVYTRRVHL
jgi:hypothetical protein